MKRLMKSQSFWPIVVLLIILAVNGIISAGAFFEIRIVENHFYGRIIDIVRNGSVLMILSIGMTMVLATGGTDISVGSVMAISGAIACSIVDKRLFPGLNGSVPLAVLLAVGAGILCGAWNGMLVSKLKLQPIVSTMILLVAGRGIAQLITNGKIVTINSDGYYFINGGYIFGLPFPMFIAAFFLIAFVLFVKRTPFGLYVESIGCNPRSSYFAGIGTDRVKWIVYMLSGMMAAVAGLIESSGIKAADSNNAGLLIELEGILAVAIGGTSLAGGRFSIPASVVGALIIQSITTTVLAMGISPQVTRVVKAVIVLVICLFQSEAFKASVMQFSRKAVKQS